MTTITASSPVKDVAFGDLPRELATTRKVLERLPEEHFAWKPHEKSMHLGRLAMHVATLPQWMLQTVQHDGLDMSSPPQMRTEPSDKADLLRTFDHQVEELNRAMANLDDSTLAKTWSLRQGEKILHSDSKAKILRVWCLNHMIHHRAQLCLYLRLLNVPVPGVYFNSADEPEWKFE